MKDRKLKKYREWFKCPYLVEERDCVTDDPYPIYQESTYCKLGRYSCFGYTGYSHGEDGTPCEKCKLPINRKQMHEILMTGKKYVKLEKACLNVEKKVKWIKEEEDKTGLFDISSMEEPDKNDPHYPVYEKTYAELDKFWND